MKTTTISIPASAATAVLKSLHFNFITCKYLGLDQSGRLLMQISHKEDQCKLISELIIYMDESEKIVNEITQVAQTFIEKYRQEQWKRLNEIKRKYHSREKTESL